MKTMYYHGLTSDGRRFTLAGQSIVDGMGLNLGIAICGTKENFIKKVGRIKAEGRLSSNSGGRKVWPLHTSCNGLEISVLMYIGAELSKLSSKNLKKQFNLYHREIK